MMLLADFEIRKLCEGNEPLIQPFTERAELPGEKSYGLSPHGYDIRLGGQAIAYQSSYAVTKACENVLLHSESEFILFPGGFLLCHSLEVLSFPSYITGMVKDKSTYARLGIAVQNTILESGWRGQITLEISNHGPLRIPLKVGEGIAQILFHKSEPSERPYDGKYQDQVGPTLPR